MEKERRRGTIAMRMRLSLKYDDQTNLAVYHWYQPETKPQAVIHLSHGMAEHILRYDDFAAFLADNGFYVIGHDHVAHGESVSDPSEIGIIKDADFMQTIINGMKLVYDESLEIFPELPRFLFSHSMGAMAAERYCELFPNDFKKVVLSGADIGSLKYGFLKSLTKFMMWFKQPTSTSQMLHRLTLGAFAQKFRNEYPRHGWLSTDKTVVIAYDCNPFCGIQFPINYFNSLARMLLKANSKKELKNISKKTEFLLISGDQDPVTNKAKAVQKRLKRYRKFKIDTTTIIYPKARHECLNEEVSIKNQVYQDLLAFFQN